MKTALPIRTRILFGLLLVTVVGAVALEWSADGDRFRDYLHDTINYSVPVHLNAEFQKMAAQADKIVIRHGGFNCCGDVDGDPILATIQDRKVIEDIVAHLVFEPDYIENASDLGLCGCCGYPGMDWYRGGKRIALMSVQHGQRLRWAGFSPSRKLGFAVGVVDGPLSKESADWFAAWLEDRGWSDKQIRTRALLQSSPSERIDADK